MLSISAPATFAQGDQADKLLGWWLFDNEKDEIGNWNDIVLHGAELKDGQLIVETDKWAHALGYTGPDIEEKTLMTWVSLDSLASTKGSALALDKVSEDQYNGIVYAERHPNQWMAGSSWFRRTEDFPKTVNEQNEGEMVYLAFTYEDIGGIYKITGYRNGVSLGSYEKGNIKTWPTGDAEAIWGKRHTAGLWGPGELNAHIEESRIYGVALTHDEIRSMKIGTISVDPTGNPATQWEKPKSSVETPQIQVDDPLFKFSIDATQIQVGDTFTLELSAETVTDLAGCQVNIEFDAAILEGMEISEGTFLKVNGNTLFQKGKINNKAGIITNINVTRLGGGVNGNGALFSVTFTAKAVGKTHLTLSKFKCGDSKGAEIPASPPEIAIVVEEDPGPPWDVDRDGEVSILDMILVAQELGKAASENPRVDINNDGTISILDLIIVAQHLGELTGPAAPSYASRHSRLDLAAIQAWITHAQIENDGSIAFQRGIANLKNLLKSLIPKRTALFANYPNPFNPETWIPYQLAEPAEVTLYIYTTNGTVVRTLALGHQDAGIYQNRSRAAYWDGKNDMGESVASGVYFFTLIAGDFTATGKMLTRK